MSSDADPESELDLFPDSSRVKLMRDREQTSARAKKQRIASLLLGAGVALAVPGIWIDTPLFLKAAFLGSSLLCICAAAAFHWSRRRMLLR